MIKRYRYIWSLCILTILFNVGTKLYIVGEQNKKIGLMQKVVAAARNEQSMKENKTVVMSETKDIRRDRLEMILQRIPDEIGFTEYASDIQALIGSNGLSSEKNLVFLPVPAGKNELLKYETRFAVLGDYSRIKKFIGEVSGLPGLVYLESINIRRENESPNVLRLTFKLSVYFRRSLS